MEEVLSRTIELSDGSLGKIFSTEPDNTTHYNCHLCRVRSLPGEYNLRIHMSGKKHIKNLSSKPEAVKFHRPLEAKDISKYREYFNSGFKH